MSDQGSERLSGLKGDQRGDQGRISALPEASPSGSGSLFSSDGGKPRRGGTLAVVLGVVVVLVGLLVVFSGHHAGGRQAGPVAALPADAYAGSLPISDLAMSESESLSGGKSTFLDGKIRNTGSATVNGITVQVFFRNAEGMPPHVETLPLFLIRTREPYVDTQPVSAAPLKPGEEREFRLIFETLPANWNTQMPELQVVGVKSR